MFLFTTLALIIIMVAGLWKTFEKGGKHGWAALVPIYNTINLLEIAGKPTWWIFFFFIPFVNMIMGIVLAHYIAISFGKGIGFTIGLIILPFVFYPILGFGDATYRKPTAPASNPSNQTPPTSTT
ncbi:MAG: signal peptidase I [Candidatus Taylorbacteria bacterium RIFCSPHIGHO2_01_FULL_45_63]|uniref:Signal peptidase I n=1 Tax=Candidatus Taylorbacteria bacterium RIFCSPHIGHO2_02_FULL_45_35 TaxID=1802311 RepID=A0A1G2MP82_9BACT|nr:MAG: signal peptidase I [Candidatus Taylorbacteria bacterium RIFCSPHIGHO2_01_FULL_45_63]OHA25678.1 MAG: signal peptidase I [Candidatus Taylorbacteria bacterium RIFCSPHIGHO2_02_FULL_45_35]OHA35085.1 MAG: signal peptidase I [Candidatus Taylorbacteria bacterium RIFCSPLOWO2_01_FULL_45_34b]